MAKIYIEPEKARSILKQEDLLEKKLREFSQDISNVRNGLNYKISGREAISARLREASTQLSTEADRIRALRNGLEQIIARYEQTEAGNVDRVAAGKTSIQETGNGNTQSRGEGLLKVSKEEMDKYIRQFERDHPHLARELNKFLGGGKNNRLTNEDIRNIKYLAYNADEPFRSIFLKSISKFSIGDSNLDEGAYYRPWAHTVNFKYSDSFAKDPRGGYTTFFHECGHAVDDLGDVSKWVGSDTENFKAYSEDMGKSITLREAIEYDVYYNEKILIV